jgi:anti-sigma factor ChrR (cupin superfamily)
LLELAAGFASGALEAAEQAEFMALLRDAPAEAKAEVSRTIDSAALISFSLPSKEPSAALKEKIFSRMKAPAPTPDMYEFVRGTGDAGWIPMKVPGAFVKLLSIQKEKGYAVVLGKLDPGTYYPAHHHIGSEQIFILSGDLSVGDVQLRAGDFHSAKAGSNHGVNHSETGCTIMAIVSLDDLETLIPR